MDKLQHRIIELSVAIEDKTKTIDLLIEAINTHNENTLENIKGEKAKYRIELNNKGKENKQAISKILESYEYSTKNKQDVSAEVEKLSARMKEENYKTKSCLLKVRETIMQNIKNAAEEWNSRRDEREELWTTKKVKHVRACTVQALQPEIKRLADSHEVELSKLTEEATIRKKYLEREISLKFQRDFNKYVEENNSRKAILVEGRLKSWKNKIKEEEERHLKNLKQLKQNQANTKDDENGIQGGISITNFAVMIKEINDDTEKQCKDLEIANQAKQVELRSGVDTLLTKKKEEAVKGKQQWYDEQKMKMQKVFEDDMCVVKQDVLKQRDKEIEVLIRRYHMAEVQAEEHFEKEKNGGVLIEATNRLSDEIEYLKQQNKSKANMIDAISKELERLKNHKQILSDSMETKEKYFINIKSQIEKIRTQIAEIDSQENHSKAHDMERLDVLDKQLSHLKEQKQSLKTEQIDKQSIFQHEIAELSEKHTLQLKQMECQFLERMAAIDDLLAGTTKETNEIKMKLENKRNILLSILNPTQKKNHHTLRRKSRLKR